MPFESVPQKPERTPPIIRGTADDEVKQRLAELLKKGDRGEHTKPLGWTREDWARAERPKNRFEIEAIGAANELTNSLLRRYGVAEFDIPESNVRIVGSAAFKALRKHRQSDAGGFADSIWRTVVLNDDSQQYKHPISRTSAIFHEIVHFKQFEIWRADQNVFPHIDQNGLQQGDQYEWLNESVVSSLEKRFLPAMLDRVPELKELRQREYDSMEAVARKKRVAGTKHDNIGRPLPVDEISWISEDGREFGFFSYNEERPLLGALINAIAKDTGLTPAEVFDEFARAHFTGDLTKVRNYVDVAFGLGTYELLGKTKVGDSASLQLMINALEGRRGL